MNSVINPRVKRIILITGTPGVGKTTFSSLLASRLNATHVNLGELVKREKLFSQIDRDRKTLIIDENKVSMKLKKIIKYIEGDVIIDGHFAIDVVLKKDVHLVFVLRRNPDELRKILENKGFRNRKLWENLAAEILDICLLDVINIFGRNKVCEIDISGQEIKDTVKHALNVLERDRKCTVGVVDWLTTINKEERLEEFFKTF